MPFYGQNRKLNFKCRKNSRIFSFRCTISPHLVVRLEWLFFKLLTILLSFQIKNENIKKYQSIEINRYCNKAIEEICVKSTWHGSFSRLAALRGIFRKNKKTLLDKVNGSICAKFQVCIVVSVAGRRDTNKYINKYIHKHTHIQVNLRISSVAARLTWILILIILLVKSC